jgi:GcrA cell cycle regulator
MAPTVGKDVTRIQDHAVVARGIEIHPEFDVETKTWFWGRREARTVAELCRKVGPNTTAKDYYPKGYRSASLMTEKRRQELAPTLPFQSSELRIVSTPKQPPKSAVMVDIAKEHKIEQPEKGSVRTGLARTPGVEWISADIKNLRQWVLEGRSAGEIAKTLRRSRNSVIGKASRLGLKLHGS